MPDLQQLIERAKGTEHGFKDLEAAAAEVLDEAERGEALQIARALLNVEPA